MKIKVRCTYTIDVEVPDGDPEAAIWLIEDNNCPGTGAVGAAFDRNREKHDEASTCWACALGGENKVIAVDGKPIEPEKT